MAKDIQGKNIVITGGAGGIGFAIADAFLDHGARLAILLDLNDTQGNEAIKKLNAKHGNGKATFIQCDVTKDLEEVTKKILDKYKSVDVLVNSAGILSEKDPRKLIELNVTALIEWSLKFIDIMRSDRGGKGGTIINVSSAAYVLVNPFVTIYRASKFAVVGFTKSQGHEYNFKKTGVRMFAVCPGLTRTGLVADFENIVPEENQDDWMKESEGLPIQDADKVGEGAVQLFQKADSGTAWLIQEGDPISEV